MTRIAVAASRQDATFAQAVLAGLPESQPKELVPAEALTRLSASDCIVLFVWGAAMDQELANAGDSLDVKALIELWSQDRLVVVRRDASHLPLGMRDLRAFGPETAPGPVCDALLRVVEHHSRNAQAPFSRNARPDRSDSIRTRPKRARGALILAVGSALAIGAAWYYLGKAERERQAVLTAALGTATRAAEELKQAQTKQLESLKALEQARAAEEAARKAGDTAKLKEAQEAAGRAEAEANKQAELVKQREAAAAAARGAASKAKTTADKQSKAPVKTPDTTAATTPTTAPTQAPVAEPVKSEPVAAAPTAPWAEPATKDTVPQISRREREELEAEARRQEELAAKAREAGKTQVAALDPMVQGKALEDEGKFRDAVRVYRLAARKGSGPAAKRLGEIYEKGVPGVGRDLAESLQWYEAARLAGESVPASKMRGGGERVPAVHPRAEVPPKGPGSASPKTEAPKSPPAPAPVEARKAAVKAPEREEKRSASSYEAIRGGDGSAFPLIAALLTLALSLGGYLFWRRARRAITGGDERQASIGEPIQAAAAASTLFVSYSHKDKARVEPIVTQIEGMGRQVWLDRTSITGQAGWAGQIVRAIRECRAVVLMASPNSYSSDQVVRELYLAMNHKKPIVPIEIEPAELPDELQYILAPYQHHRLSSGDPRAVLRRALAAI